MQNLENRYFKKLKKFIVYNIQPKLERYESKRLVELDIGIKSRPVLESTLEMQMEIFYMMQLCQKCAKAGVVASSCTDPINWKPDWANDWKNDDFIIKEPEITDNYHQDWGNSQSFSFDFY